MIIDWTFEFAFQFQHIILLIDKRKLIKSDLFSVNLLGI